jgi:hypothetical protein
MGKVIVYHRYYGCDTGCCGHTVELQDDDGNHVESRFDFSHDYDDKPREFAEDLIREEFGEEHIKDLDWDNCFITGDC